MIKFVRVMSRQDAEKFINSLPIIENKEKFAFISIYGDDQPLIGQEDVAMMKEYGCIGGLSMEFWDVTERNITETKKYFPNVKMFTPKHAKTVLNFLKDIHDDKLEVPLIVHCSAGISRSGAVGQFATDYFRLDQQIFEKLNPNVMPNPHVYSLLKNETGFKNRMFSDIII